MLEVGYSSSKFIRLSGPTLEYIALEAVTSERGWADTRYLRATQTLTKFPGRTLHSSVPSLFPKSPQEKTTEQKSDDAASSEASCARVS